METARGLTACDEIAEAVPERLLTLAFGAADFCADLGIDLDPDPTELLYARSRVVVAARAARRTAAIDGPYLQLLDIDGLIETTRKSRRMGFQCRVVVYSPQRPRRGRDVQRRGEPDQRPDRSWLLSGYHHAFLAGATAVMLETLMTGFLIRSHAPVVTGPVATAESVA